MLVSSISLLFIKCISNNFRSKKDKIVDYNSQINFIPYSCLAHGKPGHEVCTHQILIENYYPSDTFMSNLKKYLVIYLDTANYCIPISGVNFFTESFSESWKKKRQPYSGYFQDVNYNTIVASFRILDTIRYDDTVWYQDVYELRGYRPIPFMYKPKKME
jgi:hypothetical protein